MTSLPVSDPELHVDPTDKKKIDFFRANTLAFVGMHLICLGCFWTGVTPTAIWMAIILYWVRMFGITAGYHRYFAHRSYKTGRVFQFILAFIAASAGQKGPLWWAGTHRIHHKHSDSELDVHSRWYGGWLWSHVGWILSPTWEKTPTHLIQDFAKYPEIRWLEKNIFFAPMVLGLSCFLIGGASGLFFGFFFSTIVLYHCTFSINSVMHTFGKQRYKTGDTSRNNWLFAFICMGEGWHNNHHYYQSSEAQGFYWWEFDFSHYILTVLSWFGIVWDIKKVPEHVREANKYEPGAPKILRFDTKTLRTAMARYAQNASDAAHEAAEAAKDAAHRAKHAADEAAHRWAESAREAAAKASEAASEAAAKAKGSVSIAAARAAESANETAQSWSEAANEAAAKVAAALATPEPATA